MEHVEMHIAHHDWAGGFNLRVNLAKVQNEACFGQGLRCL